MPYIGSLHLHIGEITDSQLRRRLGYILEGDIRLSFSYHQMCDDQALENNRPCRVPQSILQSPKDLRYSSITGMSCDKNVVNIFQFRGRKLLRQVSVCK